jgi:hypothetical protein
MPKITPCLWFDGQTKIDVAKLREAYEGVPA